MTGKESNIAIIGAGAVGGITAVMLSQAGYRIEVACNSPALADRINSDGLIISGICGNHRIQVPAVAKAIDMSGPKDFIFLATKANDMLNAGKEILPLLSSETITRAIHRFLDNYPYYDSLFSVTRIETRLWDVLGRAINHNPAILLRTQDLPPVYEENSCLYIFSGSTLQKRHNRIGERPLMFEIDAEEAWDIDNETDFRIAEFLYCERMKIKG